MLVPGGFGMRGIEGKIEAIAVLPASARCPTWACAWACSAPSSSSPATSAGLTGANSTEFDPDTPYPVIDLLPEQQDVEDMGGTMRLGA